MDATHYSSNVNSYPSSASSTPHSLQASLPPHTLPPLQHSNQAMQQQPAYASYPHTPRTPATPNTPTSQSNMGTYPPPPANNGSRPPSYPMMTNSYQQQPGQQYPTTSAMMQPATQALSHPQPIAPAPSRGPPILRPMPSAGMQPGMQSPYDGQAMMPNANMMGQEQPTHVVGSQGRRGILPSAPGKPSAPIGAAATKTPIPQKDADGKFPCPHCTKTYLHAKHLKRHLLRRKFIKIVIY